jgi:hypothetical protein
MITKRCSLIRALLLLAGIFAPTAAAAGGPGLLVTSTGAPFRWDTSAPIVFRMDQGSLGRLSQEEAAELTRRAFATWQGLDTAAVTFEEGQLLDRNVTGANLFDALQEIPEGVCAVFFDHDGTIIDAFFGGGASRSIVAVGGARAITAAGEITQGLVLVNGRAADGLFEPDDPGEEELVRAIARAVGQMLNLDASDLNDELLHDGNPANNRTLPVMSAFNVVGGGTTLTLDDRMALSALYPSDLLAEQTGVIHGRVLLADGKTGLQGIAVVARKVDDPSTTAVSAISGATFRNVLGRGTRDPEMRGAYELRVPPGDYTVEIRPLRAEIGPLQGIFPLPGGARFYRATPSADPSSATPVTVRAGQTAEVNITAAGDPAPEPLGLNEREPNDAPYLAQNLPVSAILVGNVSAADTGPIVLDLGGGIRDDIEDLYRIEVRERSILTLLLAPDERVDLDLHVLGGVLGGAAPPRVSSASTGGDAEALQLEAGPGTYFIGVSARDGATFPPRVDYTLSVTTTPLVEPPAPPLPVLQRLVVGNVTATGAEVHWTTDLDATGDAIVSMPRQPFGDPTVGRAHRVALTGLRPSAATSLTAISQAAGAARGFLLRAFFQTALESPAEGAASVSPSILAVARDDFLEGDTARESVLVLIGLHNSGGNAQDVRLTALTPTSGWKLAEPIAEPIPVGGIGSGGAALVAVRLLRDGAGPIPFATLTGEGALAGPDGTPLRFTIGR